MADEETSSQPLIRNNEQRLSNEEEEEHEHLLHGTDADDDTSSTHSIRDNEERTSLDAQEDSTRLLRNNAADKNIPSKPLIYSSEERRSDETREETSEVLHNSEDPGDSGESIKPTLFVWALTFAAGLSGLLFGYDTGIISSTLVSIDPGDLTHAIRPLTTLEKSLITSITALLALFASPCASLLADSLGRKRVIRYADILFIVGALCQMFSPWVWTMIIGRGLIGLGVGCGSFVVPLYISELSPSYFRGRLVTVYSLFVTGGQVVAYLVGWSLTGREQGWRWMVGSGAVPAILQLILLSWLPETPRWLVTAARGEEAIFVLSKVYGKSQKAQDIAKRVMSRVEEEAQEEEAYEPNGQLDGKAGIKARLWHLRQSFKELLANGANRRALAIACMLQGLQQFCGFNSLMYFSATIFSMLGFTDPTLTSLTVAITNFVFTIIAFYLIDLVGRRRILLYSIPFMILGLVLSAIAFNFIDFHVSSLSLINVRQEVAPEPPPERRTTFWPVAVVLATTLYVAAYAIGLGCVPWQQSELFALRVRAVGSGLATSTNWGSNFVVGLTFLPMMDALTPSVTFGIYAIICVVGYAGVWKIYPETAGSNLEDMRELLSEGWGVKESVRRWRMKTRKVP